MKTRFVLCLFFAAALAPALLAKDSGCTTADFGGTWGITVTGTILPGLPISGSFARLGKVVADGQGNTTATTLAIYNGNPTVEDFTGVYQVSDNCYLTWQATLPTGNLAVRFEGAITGDNNEVYLFIADPPGAVLFGRMTKLKTSACTVADFKGTYALDVNGSVAPGLPISGPFARMGQVVADGAGNASATSIASYTGAVLRENFSAPYTVSSDCHLVWNVTLPPPVGLPVTFEANIQADGNELMAMITAPPGAVILGSMTRQRSLTSSQCTNASLSGSFGLIMDGSILQSAGNTLTGPFARAATLVFDGKGAFSAPAQYSSYNGAIIGNPYSGTYAVKANCTATLTANVGPPTSAPETLTATIADQARELHLMVTSPAGSTVTAVMRPLAAQCSLASFAGDYEFDMDGSFIGGPLGGPFKRIGKLSSDGAGGFTATTTADYGGQIVPEDFTGSYVVDQNCTMTMLHELNGVNVTLVGPLVDNGNGAYVVVASAALAGPGTPVTNAIIGTLKRQ